MSQTELEMRIDEAERKWQRDRNMMIDTGLNRGREKGRPEGTTSGLIQGLEFALELKFGAFDAALIESLRAIDKLDRPQASFDALTSADSLDEFRAALG